MPRRRRRFVFAAAAGLVVAAAAVVAFFSLRPLDGTAAPPPGHRPNLLLVSIDTLRADRVGRGLTPAIDAIGARGLSFANVRTVAPLTLPAHVSLMTGLFPPAHGVRANGVGRFDGKHPTLATLLHASGYRTAAFVAAYVLDRRFGLAAGFDVYDDQIRRDPAAPGQLDAERPGNVVADRAIAWMSQRRADDGPFFAWVHLYDPHAPYAPPAPFLEKAHGQAYDGEVAFADAQVARLVATLDELNFLANTLVVVCGDHGESLGEHGEATHGMLVFEPALRVPFVAAGPGVPRAVRRQPVSLVDVAPSILQLLGRPVPSGMRRSDIVGSEMPSADVYSETEYPRTAGWSSTRSLVDERWKLVESAGARLFDLQSDPNEQRDVARDHEAVVRTMSARLGAIRATAAATASDNGVRPAADVSERLRSLGYVAGSPDTSADSGGPDPATVVGSWNRFQDALNAIAVRQYARALPALRDLVTNNPGAAVFQSTYIRALQDSGDVGGALAEARHGVARHPRDAAMFHALAVAARDAKRPDEAVRAEQAALALDPEDPVAHNGLGLLQVDQGRPGQAAAEFERAAQIDPTNAEYWTNLGNAHRDSGNAVAAEQAYRRALEAEPTSADAANGLGVLLVQAGRPADAIRWLEEATRIDATFYSAWLNLGIACQQAGQRDRAVRAYREVLRAPARFAREREGATSLLRGLEGEAR